MPDRFHLDMVVFETTDACNQSCKFCYNHFKSQQGYTMDAPNFAMAKKSLQTLLQQAEVGSISLSGGEPLLLPRLFDLILKVRFAGSQVHLLTNGTLLTDDAISFCRDLGVEMIQIPILAPNAELHDSITGLAGSWQRAVAAARKIAQWDSSRLIPVFILSALNIDQTLPTLELYRDMGVKRIMFNRFNVGGLGIQHWRELRLTTQQLQNTFAAVSRFMVENDMTANSGVCSPICILDPKRYPGIRFAYCNTDISHRPITVNYRGDVRYCNHSPKVLGNIHDKPIDKILTEATASGYFDSVPKACAKCNLWNRCRGGCRAASEQLYGRFDLADPILSE